MLSRYRQIDDSLVKVRPDERPWAFLVHALGWIPIWGFVINAGIWLYFKNRSREMVFHIQQSIQFQIVVLIPVLTWVVCSIMTAIVTRLSPAVGGFLQTANTFLLAAALTGCALLALFGGALVYIGKGFLYPVIGRRVLEGAIKKITEE